MGWRIDLFQPRISSDWAKDDSIAQPRVVIVIVSTATRTCFRLV